MTVVPYSVDETKIPTSAHCGNDYCDPDSAYVWDRANSYTSLLTSQTSCEDTGLGYLKITSNAIPDHQVADFPLRNPATGTLGNGEADGKKPIAEQTISWLIPSHPKRHTVGVRQPVSVIGESALKKAVGFAVNGVPLVSYYQKGWDVNNQNDLTNYEVRDLCHGRTDGSSMYHYTSTPWCIFQDSSATEYEFLFAHGLLTTF
jgi:hypothetical protein